MEDYGYLLPINFVAHIVPPHQHVQNLDPNNHNVHVQNQGVMINENEIGMGNTHVETMETHNCMNYHKNNLYANVHQWLIFIWSCFDSILDSLPCLSLPNLVYLYAITAVFYVIVVAYLFSSSKTFKHTLEQPSTIL
eukprot:TRINITY_DN2803_c0_g1_i1.p1 TRINITY_DN2803_c0_g1~~TRINITY_DN2803_c0_g1_i1.p1  ORF type:complete len:153 (+),score=16.59 TRINITY_DN2803_c0_g1_i1:51-461(+)